MGQDELRNTFIPVGAMMKDEVRAYLDDQGQSIASKPESMDICFVSGTVPEFIERHTGRKIGAGKLVTSSGEVIWRT